MSTRLQILGQSAPSEIEIPQSALGLRADRTDISFENITPELVRVDVHVTNDGDFWSPASSVSLQSAPLGVFLAWHPLFSLTVPALAPHSSATVSGTAWAPQPKPVTCADLWSMPPHLLQEFVETAAREEREEAEREARRQVRRPAPILAADPMAVLGRSGTYWAGNIDILMHGKAAERHMAHALRIYPGKTNAAMFFVGDRADGYKFELSGDVEDWKAEMVGHEGGSPRSRKGRTTPTGEFLEFTRGTFYLLMRPPADAQKGFISIHVTRQSDGKQAQVEFNLDSRSAGAGCYKV